MNWVKIEFPKIGIAEVDNAKAYASGGLRVLVSIDGPDKRWHLSISHPNRYPTWDEIKQARYDLTPNHVTMAQLLPPKEEYVNLHPNTFHLHEVRMRE